METLNLDLLPEEGRKEVVHFYKRLLKKYKSKQLKTNNEIEELKKELLVDKIMIDTKKWKFNRDELHER